MRIRTTKTKNTTQYAIIYDTTSNGKRTTKIYENLGTLDKIKIRANNKCPLDWMKNYVSELNQKIKDESLPIIIKKTPNVLIEKNNTILLNGGYLFLQKIYYNLKMNDICNEIANKYQFKFDLNDILSKLIYGRIIYPSSKLKTFEESKKFIEQPNFEYHQIGRALEIINKEFDFIQSQLYKNSCEYKKRNNKILYYDLTNFFFEIEQEDGIKKYGISKEHKPNPIVQMGLFMDGDGIPLAFEITPGNTNEQLTLTPLERKIIKDFKLSTLVVCTDAGLASKANRKFNDTKNRKFITTQSIKKLNKELKEWSLDKKGWQLPELPGKIIDISSLDSNEELADKWKDKIFYKEKWIKDVDAFEQRIIVAFSIKYKNYQKSIRQSQINRAQKLIDSNPKKIGKPKQNDFKRFISNIVTTDNGEVAENDNYSINQNVINDEARYDGFYAVCSNLEDNAKEIVKANHQRWEIEESFRIMKSEFKARPVYLSRDDRIKAHFMTCFLALTIFRYLEKELGGEYTYEQIIKTLKNINFLDEKAFGYRPMYERNELTDLLHEKALFRTDYEITSYKKFKNIINQTKK